MKGIAVVSGSEVEPTSEHPIDGHGLEGGGWCRLVSPTDYSLWMVAASLAAGSELRLPAVHGDEAVHVSSGALAVDGRVCPAGGAVIVEAAAPGVIRALEPSRVVHMGPTDPVVPTDGLNGPPTSPGGQVHVVGPGGQYAAVDEHRESRYFADSTCPTCRLTLLYTSRTTSHVSVTHSHSTDELIHLLWGEMRLGSLRVSPGDTIAVEADRRYGFRAPAVGFGFLNYRRDASQQIVERGSEPRLEGALVNGFEAVMDLC